MGAPPSQLDAIELLLILSGAPAMIYLLRRGFLRPGSLRDAPPRRAGLGAAELLLAAAMLLVCASLAGTVLVRMHLMPAPLPTASPPATAPTTLPGTAPATRPTTAPASRPASHPTTSAATSAPATEPAAPPPPNPRQDWRHAAGFVVFQLIAQLPVVLLILIMSGLRPGGWRELGVIPRRWREELRLGLVMIPATVPPVFDVIVLMQVVAQALHLAPPQTSHEMLNALTQSTTLGATLLMIFSAVVLAPVFEETIFRGLVQTAFLSIMGPRARWVSIALAAAVFTSMHIGSGVPWQQLPGLFFLALVLGWVYERTGSLLPGILIHAGFNGVNTALALSGAG